MDESIRRLTAQESALLQQREQGELPHGTHDVTPVAPAPCVFAQSADEAPPVGLTEDELKDWHLRRVEGLRAGLCMQAALKAGNRQQAVVYQAAMYRATRARIALRALGNERLGGCYFDAAGQVDARGQTCA